MKKTLTTFAALFTFSIVASANSLNYENCRVIELKSKSQANIEMNAVTLECKNAGDRVVTGRVQTTAQQISLATALANNMKVSVKIYVDSSLSFSEKYQLSEVRLETDKNNL